MEAISNALAHVDTIGLALRTATLNVNRRCPLRCRHCSVGFSEHRPVDNRKVSLDEIEHIVGALDPSVYDMLLLAGGEPSLDVPLLRKSIDSCRARGLLSAIVTAPIWATKQSTAERFISQIAGLDLLILSYDRYHLEFLDAANYETAVKAAVKGKIAVNLHISHVGDDEPEELLRQVAEIRPLVKISTAQVVPVGNAAGDADLAMESVPIRTDEDLERLPRSCVLGNVLIEEHRAVHGCCWSTTVPGSPFSISVTLPTLRE
jgi:organic radical activating enzyme